MPWRLSPLTVGKLVSKRADYKIAAVKSFLFLTNTTAVDVSSFLTL